MSKQFRFNSRSEWEAWQMSAPFSEQFEVFTTRATDSEVSVYVAEFSLGRIRAFHGELSGPHCKKAKTLQASFEVGRCECEHIGSHATSFIVTEPCYWTPELPMLYDLTLELELSDGKTATWRQAIGLCRWEIHGRDFFRGKERTVLRGVFADECSSEVLAQADRAEVTLVVRDPSDEALERASQLGVMLVADLRGFEGEVAPAFKRYALHPSVILVLFDDDNSCAFYKPYAVKLGIVCGAAEPQAADMDLVDVIVFELAPDERPPAWAATCAKPVIAIRRSGAYAELSAARQGCDRLQAELAPEFDLAGYFV